MLNSTDQWQTGECWKHVCVLCCQWISIWNTADGYGEQAIHYVFFHARFIINFTSIHNTSSFIQTNELTTCYWELRKNTKLILLMTSSSCNADFQFTGLMKNTWLAMTSSSRVCFKAMHNYALICKIYFDSWIQPHYKLMTSLRRNATHHTKNYVTQYGKCRNYVR